MIKLIRSLCSSLRRAVIYDPEMRKLTARHPILFRFLKNRLTSDETFGLHLTLGVLASSACVYVFFGLIHNLIGDDSIFEVDTAFLNLFQLMRTAALDRIMVFVTYLGSWFTLFCGTIAVSGMMIVARRRHYLIGFLSSLLVSEIAVFLIGNLFEYARPPILNVGIHTIGFSVSSGQFFAVLSFYGLCGYVLYRFCERWYQKVGVLLVIGSFLFLLGISRIYLGLEWPADVLASSASGVAWLSILITILEIRRAARDGYEPEPPMPLSHRCRLGALVGIVWLSLATGFFATHPFHAVTIPESQEIVDVSDIPDRLFEELPRYSETLFGTPTEPINVIVVARDDAFAAALERSGWNRCDDLSPATFFRAVRATIFGEAYLTAPGLPTFWNARPNDFSYEKLTPAQTVRERHHVHFWKTAFELSDGRHVWLATAHFDRGIKLKTPIIFPAHTTDPAVDKERELLIQDIKTTGFIEEDRQFSIVEPVLGKNSLGDQFFTDGKSHVLFLKEAGISRDTR